MGLASSRDRSVLRYDLLISEARTRVVPHALVALRAVIAIGIAAGVTALIAAGLPRTLDVRTDVVGNPIFANFNVNRYLWVYALWVAFFPLAAVGLDIALSRMTRKRLPHADWGPAPAPGEASRPASSEVSPSVAGLRTAFVGAVLGVEISIASDLEGTAFLLAVLAVLALYTAAAASVAGGLLDRRQRFLDRVATVNIFAVPLTLFGLYGVSEATQMQVLDSGKIFEYRWFPLPVAVAVTAVLTAVAVWAIRRSGYAVAVLERWFLLLVAAPVLLFLVLARLPGELGPIDFFHEGEPLAAAALSADGMVPWRDLMFIHGLLHDVLTPLAGLGFFENTRWGSSAGALMLVVPFYWLTQYFLFAYLFRHNVLFLLGTQLAVVLGLVRDVHFRFLLMPFVLLLLAAVLRKPTWLRSAALAVVLAVQAVLSPEMTIAIPACLAVLALYELFARDGRGSLASSFRRTLRTAACGAAALVVLGLTFAAFGILDDFFFFYRTFFSDHSLTGGIPIAWIDTRFRVAALAPVALVVLTFWFFATAWRSRRSPAIDDWVMAALAITVLLYYPKFLARADHHVYQVWAVTVPLLAYAAYRVLQLIVHQVERTGLRLPVRNTVTAVAVLVVAFLSPEPILSRAEAIPGRVSSQAHFDPVSPHLSFLSPNATSLEMIGDIERLLDAYLAPDEHVFDFSNNPMLFHYLLERRPSTRYFHASMAIRKHTQADLVNELERREPKLVVFSSNRYIGLPTWDNIPNQVRHYDVSDYLLDHYRPLLASYDFLLLARNDSGLRLRPELAPELSQPPATDNLYFRTLPCDWGYAPNFLSTGPSGSDRSRAVDVEFRPTEGVAVVTGWAVDLEAKAPAQRVVAALGRRVYAEATPSGDRADIAGGLQDQRFLSSGFTLAIPGSAPLQELRFYALTSAGTARELIYGPDSGLAPTSRTPDRVILGGRSYRVVPGGIHGWAETAAGAKPTLELDVPEAARGYDWLEVRTRSPLVHDALGITDARSDQGRTISFKTLDRGRRTVQIHVGACSQWRGFGRPLYLESAQGQAISGIRMIP